MSNYNIIKNDEFDNLDRVYVQVDARFDSQGVITPLALYWEDGRKFEIDKILDVRRAPSLKAGGIGMRYTVRILHKPTYLFYEDPRWFMERK